MHFPTNNKVRIRNTNASHAQRVKEKHTSALKSFGNWSLVCQRVSISSLFSIRMLDLIKAVLNMTLNIISSRSTSPFRLIHSSTTSPWMWQLMLILASSHSDYKMKIIALVKDTKVLHYRTNWKKNYKMIEGEENNSLPEGNMSELLSLDWRKCNLS